MKFSIIQKLTGPVQALTFFQDEKLPLKELEADIGAKRFKKEFGQLQKVVKNNTHFIVLCLGKKQKFTLHRFRNAVGKIIKAAIKDKHASLALDILHTTKSQFTPGARAQALVETALLANYNFEKYLNKEKHQTKITSLQLLYHGDTLAKYIKRAQVIASATNYARDLVNDVPDVVSPQELERQAKALAKKHSKLSCRVLNEKDLKRLKINALLGVGRGSALPPRLIFLHYKGSTAPLKAIIGKGITFDSGGYNIKPSGYMKEMKSDMGGAAAVIGTIKAAAELGLKQNLLGVMSCAENMVSRNAQRPGDIVKAYNGKTIEIHNTDAEGRLALADALAFTEKNYKPEVMIDLATLTGACVVAVGNQCAAAVGHDKDQGLINDLQAAGHLSSDRIWQLPFYEEFQGHMDGTISDLQNLSKHGRWAGSITAGVFLSKFVDKAKWVHLDIAGSAFLDREINYLAKGATGAGVRALSYWLLGQSK